MLPLVSVLYKQPQNSSLPVTKGMVLETLGAIKTAAYGYVPLTKHK